MSMLTRLVELLEETWSGCGGGVVAGCGGGAVAG
jgi:hypothetical protein